MTRVAVIGGGPSGIAAAKEALEAGLEPVLFEKSGSLGGLWRAEKGGMWESMRPNVSRYTCAFSDFPWPGHAPDFPAAPEVGRYIEDYAAAFRVPQYARLRTPVVDVRREGDQWLVASVDPNYKTRQETFPHIVVASGIFQKPYIPRIENIGQFDGKTIHSAAYKSAESFFDWHVTVVGSSYSGSEIASDLADNGIAVTQVVRTPAWVISRYIPGADTPIDLAFYRHKKALTAPQSAAERNRAANAFFAKTFGNPGDSDEKLRLDPSSSVAMNVVVSDRFLEHVRAGHIALRSGEVANADRQNIILADGEKIKTDAIVFATGYRLGLPFLGPEIRQALGHDENDSLEPVILHKETFHPALPGMAFAGLYRGPYFGVMELQARWAAGVFSGAINPPAKDAMEAGLEESRAIRHAVPRPQFPRRDYVGFADSIAEAMGVKPDAAQESGAVADAIAEGPLVPAHYRLQGPGAKRPVALQAIDAVEKRLNARRFAEARHGS